MAFYKTNFQFSYICVLTPKLTRVQNFRQRCFKHQYISYQINITYYNYDVLEEADCTLFKKLAWPPLYPSLPKTKERSVCLRVPSSQLPRVNTQHL